MAPENQQWLTAILEEYKSLRTESLSSMTNQQSTLRYAVTAIGVSLTLAFNLKDSTARFAAFSLFVPVLSLVFYVLYANEFARMVRVGRYIDCVENTINAIFKEMHPPLGWEQWLEKRVNGRKPRLPFYFAVPALFALSSVFSSIMAWHYRQDGPFCIQWNRPFIIATGMLVPFVMAAIRFKLQNIRQKYDKYFQ